MKNGPGWVFVVLVSVDPGGGGSDRFVVPLSVALGAAAAALFQNNPGAIVARFGPLDDHSILYDSARDEAAGVFLLDAMEAGTEMKTKYGLLKGFTTPLYKMVLRDTDKPFKVAMGSAEQSNTSLHYGERFILKIFRRMGFGVNPEMEMGLALSSPPVFNNIPKTVGGLDYLRKGEETSTLGIMHERMENQGSGWNHALAELGRFFERVVARGDEPPPADYLRRSVVALTEVEPPPIAAELLGGYLKAAATLGRRTAEMHLALASRMNAPDFTPEPLTSADLATYAQSMRDSAGKTLRTLESMLNRLPETARDQAHRILSERTRLLDRLKAPKTGELPSGKIRCHGDYHLGQVLWVENDFILLDFEGEPSRSLAERRMKQSPLKDVAGMLGSFDYAVLTALASHIADRPESATRLAPWGAFWRSAVASTFLKAYRDTVGDTGMIPTDSAVLESTLTLYQLDKTFYELHYEINNRPDWVFIPMEKILAVLDRK